MATVSPAVVPTSTSQAARHGGEGRQRLLRNQITIDQGTEPQTVLRGGQEPTDHVAVVGLVVGPIPTHALLHDHQLVRVDGCERVARCGYAELGRDPVGVARRFVDGAQVVGRTAHQDRPAEEALRSRDRQQRGTGHGPRGLTRDRDVGRVTAERRDVLLNPLERCEPIEHAAIGRRVPQREKALDPEPIVDGDHHGAVAGETAAVVPRAGVAPVDEAATVDPDEHRQGGRRADVRGEHVHVQAVVARDDRLGNDRETLGRLRCGGAVGITGAHAVPRIRWARRA